MFPLPSDSLDWPQTSSSAPEVDKSEKPCSLDGQESTKRKRSHSIETQASRVLGEPINKRARISSSRCAAKATEEFNAVNEISGANEIPGVNEIPGDSEIPSDNEIDSDKELPIEHWRKTGSWPRKLFQPNPNMSQLLNKKRSSSTMSYTKGVKQGQFPPSHTPAYESQILRPAGIILDQQLGEESISDDCRELCNVLVSARYEPPEHSLFEEDLFLKVLNGLRNKNEARVVRDISPWLIPSAELLFMRGVSELKDLTEEVDAEWTYCVPLVGPWPKPDFAVGFRATAFTKDEIVKLSCHSTPEKPALFNRKMYFPFLTCEAKVRFEMYHFVLSRR